MNKFNKPTSILLFFILLLFLAGCSSKFTTIQSTPPAKYEKLGPVTEEAPAEPAPIAGAPDATPDKVT